MSDTCKRHGRVRCDECREINYLRKCLDEADNEISRLEKVSADLEADLHQRLAASEAHEQQTHERLGAILGTDTSLEDAAKRMAERLAAAERVLECGHTARFTTSHFGGEKHGESYCTLCELDALTARLAAVEAERDECHDLMRSFWKHWDCDSYAHKYGSPCRCCEAEELLNKHEAAKGGRDGKGTDSDDAR